MTESAPYSLLAELEKVKSKEPPPIHLWHPDKITDSDMEIKKDGTWFYLGTPITRQRLVRLFSTVLRKESDGHYYLVTPVEKSRIKVEDVPFLAISMDVKGEGEDQILTFTTNMADEVVVDENHPLRFEFDPQTEEPSPYVMVRDGLEAKLGRSVYYHLADLCIEKEGIEKQGIEKQHHLGVWSAGIFFKLLKV